MQLKRTMCVGLSVLGATAAVAATAVADASAKITEAGSSLVYPLADRWASHYTGDDVSTASGGSVAGILDIQQGSIDIGASDAPMTADQYGGDNSGTPVQVPWALSATGVGYNIPGIKSGLQLNAKILARIYTGKITSWGDPAILALNRPYRAALKKVGKITPVYRSDGSGDTYVFQHFLTAAAGSAWPYSYATSWGGNTGVGENGNGGIAGEVKGNAGTIGYVSIAYLFQQHISTARIENTAGKFNYPNAVNIAAAAKSNTKVSAQGPNFAGVSIVNPGKAYPLAYPISTYTYAIVNRNNPNLPAVQAFLKWVVTPAGGQRYGIDLGFLPLPLAIRNADTGLINSL